MAIRFHILTLFPDAFTSVLSTTMLQKGQERGVLRFELVDIRDFTSDKHRVADDTPYGGGQGMVMKPEPVVAALESIAGEPWRILLTPRGRVFDQQRAAQLATLPGIALVCGRYEGIDERVRAYVDEEISIGDYILSGGEIGAMVVIDAVSRLVPGVLGCEDSAADESFAAGLLEYPQYTRPPKFRGADVPDILLSGDHKQIARWRRRESLRCTFETRPDLLDDAELDDDDRAFLATLKRDG